MFAFTIVDPQTFAAPQRAIFPHADTVQRQSNHIAAIERPAVLGKTCSGMSMVMQYRFGWQIHFAGPLAGNIARVGIMHDTLWRKIINILDQA
ncbi:hypothetical protein SDC9_167244 [bioreactor metagenome]|uniref:Uncharacterized protein n=1 Tax=bioreactor metagenome TaxID=1076179 RepID=A0A645G231_9ZZZZ